MLEVAQEVLAYLLEKPVLYAIMGCLAGFAGNKTVAYERRSGFLIFLIVGAIGLFLGLFVIFFFGLKAYLEKLPEFRFLFDFVAAYVGAFFVAAIIHFIKPL
ncbi:MAG TPA: hypothetical protein VE616_10350 [Candidatus Udaeobacter sp.]|jgi:uncharacterized membrane protein YeaQ/YmgE (transglycosylase-associated protein family)|nr:hypothetical protein [Candidatus Udaeobacter sp.]